ncbi:hypothetical protein CA234_12005, partial [Sphingomonas sp. ABOLE]|uniref:alpha-L-fucosidase n=1 Tax=Sphingomonas sp. ABOLE TaxID=1985878 RepID=UPI001001725F
MTNFTKREILAGSFATALAVKAGTARAQQTATAKLPGADVTPVAAPGPFKPTDASLSTYKTPDWFRDAKFGIWAHWGPQAVAGQGDWYARFRPNDRHSPRASRQVGRKLSLSGRRRTMSISKFVGLDVHKET